MRGDHKLNRGSPVAVEHHDGVVVEGFENLFTKSLETWNEADFFASV